MTKQKSNEIKKALKKEGLHYQTYFHRENETLKVILFRDTYDGNFNEKDADLNKIHNEKILEVLSALTKNALRPKYKKEKIRTRNSYYEYNQYSIIFE